MSAKHYLDQCPHSLPYFPQSFPYDARLIRARMPADSTRQQCVQELTKTGNKKKEKIILNKNKAMKRKRERKKEKKEEDKKERKGSNLGNSPHVGLQTGFPVLQTADLDSRA